jgi:hypothetical protein
MKCRECGKEASVRVTKIADGRASAVIGFCEEHARKRLPERREHRVSSSWPECDTYEDPWVTQSQIARGETIPFHVAGLRSGRLRLSKSMRDGSRLRFATRDAETNRPKGNLCLTIRVRQERQPEGA